MTPWRFVVLGILILLFRRLPFVVGLTKAIPVFATWRESAFSGCAFSQPRGYRLTKLTFCARLAFVAGSARSVRPIFTPLCLTRTPVNSAHLCPIRRVGRLLYRDGPARLAGR